MVKGGGVCKITPDFSDRKLGENFRKLLSGPTQKTELACAAVHKINTAFRCAMTHVYASAPILISLNTARCTNGKGDVVPQTTT